MLQRRGKAYYMLKNTDKAREDLMKCDRAEKEVARLLDGLDKLEKKATQKQKKQFAGMFDKMSKEDQQTEPPKPEGAAAPEVEVQPDNATDHAAEKSDPQEDLQEA